MSEYGSSLPLSWSSALPGERVTAEHGMSATATNDYRWMDGDLYRRFAWCSDAIAPAPTGWPRGEWFWVQGRWEKFQRKAAA